MEIKGLTYEEIMELYHNGGPVLKEWLHDNAHKIMEKKTLIFKQDKFIK